MIYFTRKSLENLAKKNIPYSLRTYSKIHSKYPVMFKQLLVFYCISCFLLAANAQNKMAKASVRPQQAVDPTYTCYTMAISKDEVQKWIGKDVKGVIFNVKVLPTAPRVQLDAFGYLNGGDIAAQTLKLVPQFNNPNVKTQVISNFILHTVDFKAMIDLVDQNSATYMPCIQSFVITPKQVTIRLPSGQPLMCVEYTIDASTKTVDGVSRVRCTADELQKASNFKMNPSPPAQPDFQ